MYISSCPVKLVELLNFHVQVKAEKLLTKFFFIIYFKLIYIFLFLVN